MLIRCLNRSCNTYINRPPLMVGGLIADELPEELGYCFKCIMEFVNHVGVDKPKEG